VTDTNGAVLGFAGVLWAEEELVAGSRVNGIALGAVGVADMTVCVTVKEEHWGRGQPARGCESLDILYLRATGCHLNEKASGENDEGVTFQ
jgi:hypothetical protein